MLGGVAFDAELEDGEVQAPHHLGDHHPDRSTVEILERMHVQRLSFQVGEGFELQLDVAGADAAGSIDWRGPGPERA